jgi:hypothetical protein
VVAGGYPGYAVGSHSYPPRIACKTLHVPRASGTLQGAAFAVGPSVPEVSAWAPTSGYFLASLRDARRVRGGGRSARGELRPPLQGSRRVFQLDFLGRRPVGLPQAFGTESTPSAFLSRSSCDIGGTGPCGGRGRWVPRGQPGRDGRATAGPRTAGDDAAAHSTWALIPS